MATVKIEGGAALEAYLEKLARKAKPGVLGVGFYEDARYSSGMYVAAVAAFQDFGVPSRSIPPTAFFRNVPKAHAKEWGPELGGYLKAADYDSAVALGQMGEVIKGEVRDSILETNSPPLSPITLMLRKLRLGNVTFKGKTTNRVEKVTGATVGLAARLVAEGAPTGDVNSKRLIDVGQEGGVMLRSVTSRVAT